MEAESKTKHSTFAKKVKPAKQLKMKMAIMIVFMGLVCSSLSMVTGARELDSERQFLNESGPTEGK